MGKTRTERNIEAVDTGFVRAEVARRGLKYQDIAETLQITPTDLSRKVNGRQAFSVYDVDRLADVLGCTTDQIFGRA